MTFGAAQITLGFGGVSRGSAQMSEAMSDRSGASPRNLLGLLPMGQEFDDPLEPGMFEFFKKRASEAVADPAGAAKQSVCDLLALRSCAQPPSQNPAGQTETPREEKP
jgi:hypothetical protein